jgi:predicted transcriptional regulator
MVTVAIRIPAATHRRLRRLADRRRQPIGAVLEAAVDLVEAELFFDEFDAELDASDVTLADGLEDYPWDE